MDPENVVIPTTPVDNSSPNRAKYEGRFTSTKSSLQSSLSSASLPRRPLQQKALANQQQRTGVLISSGSSEEVRELKSALAEALKENETLSETVKLLKVEIERLAGEAEELQEYAELYLLSKELIEQQSNEIAELKRKLCEYEGDSEGVEEEDEEKDEE